jgi:uncharacterized protein
MPTKKRSKTAKNTVPTLAAMRPVILRIAARYGASNVRVFGSFARGDQGKSSYVDLLVTLPARASLLDVAGIKVDLEEALDRKVDVLTDDGISRYLRDRILAEAKPL